MTTSRKPHRIRFEVLPDKEGGWSVTRDRVVTAGFDTKVPAVAHAVACCRKLERAGSLAELLIKGKNGRIQDARTYGKDPRDTPG